MNKCGFFFILTVLIFPAFLSASTVEKDLEKATLLFENRQYQNNLTEAIKVLELSLKNYPQASSLFLPLSKYYFTLAEYHETQDPLKKVSYQHGLFYAKQARQAFPDSIETRFWYGLLLDRDSKYKPFSKITARFTAYTVKDQLESILNQKPSYADAYYVLAQLYRESPRFLSVGNLSKAKKYILIALQYNDKRLRYYLELGKIRFMLNDLSGAKKSFEKIVELPHEQSFYFENEVEKKIAEAFIKRINEELQIESKPTSNFKESFVPSTNNA